jgi:hypothetical protein
MRSAQKRRSSKRSSRSTSPMTAVKECVMSAYLVDLVNVVNVSSPSLNN